MQGNIACAEGAIAAGCTFFSGYPITPATEISERLAIRMPDVGGVYAQLEDEIAALSAVIGASWTGRKSMTATSGPGISLMLENVGFAVGVETPCVIVNVQRGAPTTGVPAVELQGDVVQPRRGSHGEYEIIAICPSSPQEMFDHTLLAFNLSEKYRTPVFVLADAFVGHMREEVVIPESVETIDRNLPEEGTRPEEIKGFLNEDVAPMPIFGKGFRTHVTSSCHDEYGKRNVIDAHALDNFIRKLRNKILKHRQDIVVVEPDFEGCDVVLVSYGSVSRCSKEAARRAREEGLNVGTMRLVTLWPFPEEEIRDMAEKVDRVIVMENNMGQIYPYIKAEASCSAEVEFLPPETLGELHRVEYVLDRLRDIA